jgi:NAD(P)-dependent dehydrogenase (short-subunit alcohol dehydrogenase family)
MSFPALATDAALARDPAAALAGRRMLIIGAGSNLGRALARTAGAAGAELVLAGPDRDRLLETAARIDGPAAAEVRPVDLADEASIAALAERAGAVDHVVSTAAMPANGPIAELSLTAVERAFRAKVTGPLMLVKHLAPRMPEDGSIALFSGVAAWRPSAGRSVMATTNAAVATLVEALAVELAPLRVNAISPGIVDSGAWDRMGPDKDAFLERTAAANPARRVGAPADVIQATLLALTNPYITGTVLHVDGGGRLA